MANRERKTLLLPVDKRFLWGSIFLSVLITLIPLGNVTWLPDVVLATLVFWCIRQPRIIGIKVAFLLGLLMDVHRGAMLGSYALAYSLAAFILWYWRHRLRWFNVFLQSFMLFSLFLLVHVVVWLLQLAAGGTWAGWGLLLAPVFESLLYPLLHVVLLAPQRRAPNRDLTRPL